MNKENNAKKLSNDVFPTGKTKIGKTHRFLLIFILVFVWLFSGWPKIQEAQAETITDTYSTAGSFTWTAPTGITSATVECWGGGGGGGLATNIGGGGGGGGAYAKSTVSVTPGNNYAVVVGAGGARDTAGSGGNSTFNTTVVVAAGGTNSTTATGAAGGTTANSTGDVKSAGGTGGTGLTTDDTGGGGGGAAGPDGAGNNGQAGQTAIGGVGGSGDAGLGGTGGTAGNASAGGPGGANALGGGGGGGGDNGLAGGVGGAPGGGGGGGEAAAGQTGGAGQCIITYTNLTILGNGASEPSATTIGPGGSITDLDNFTLQTATTTDTVTAITVTLGPTGAYNNIAQVDITDTSNVAKCTAVTGLISDTVTFPASTCNIAVTTIETTYKIRITPKTHANMPYPGASYATTGTVTDITCGNSKSLNDSGSATITVDNSPPADATWGTITPGNQQIALNWTNPGVDFYRVVILRKTGSAVTDAPTDGTEYVQDNTIGTSIVRYVGALETFTDTGLTNGTNYYYKIFAYDSYINYASGVGTGPHTPILTLSISVSPTTWGVGTVDVNTVQVSTSGTKIGITNDGNVTETFNLQIFDEDDRNEWTHASLKTGAGNNIYVLSGIFCATGDSPILTSFNVDDSEDVLTTTQQTATSAKFAYAGGSANAVSVPVGEARSLWLRLDMPTAVSGTYPYDQHTITVRIGCQQ